jgi:hypothetical protein
VVDSGSGIVTDQKPVDILVEAGDPAYLDTTIQALPGCVAAVLGGPDYVKHDGCWVIRCFVGAPALKFMVEHQGYAKVVRELDELL